MALSAAVLAAVAGLGAQPAAASPRLEVGIFDDGQTLFNGERAFPLFSQLRVEVLRVSLRWGGPNGVATRRPTRPSDPADPAYDWRPYDTAVERAKSAGIEVVFSIVGTPRWANDGAGFNRAPTDFGDLRRFAYAAATRYSGTYEATEQRFLPAVRRWLAWNEPNNPVYLKPQLERVRGRVVYRSAIAYARICNAIYAGVHGTLLAGRQVACGVTAPRGNNDASSARPSVSPLAFLRAARKAGLRRFDAYAHHPYYGNRSESPRRAPRPPANGRPTTAVTLGNIQTLVDEVTRLYGPKRLWITEYGYQTNPPDTFFGVSWNLQASYLKQAFGLARAHPRIDLMLWFLLQDEPVVSGWQSGLLTSGGVQKPAFKAYQSLRR
ncbi:MAG: hypothetical protein ABR521_10660 [Gaiellaceae bacterium]